MKLCKTCGKEVIKKSCDSKAYFLKKKYCSVECAGLSLRKIKTKTDEQIKKEDRRKFREGYCKRGKCHPLYDVWRNMKRRCYYKNSKCYKNYGGRGIIVCDEWLSDFNIFLKWALENKWKKGLTIDRINNDGNYEPSNCKWSTMHEQLLNRRNNHFIVYKGKRKTISEWSKILGIHKSTLSRRIEMWNDIDKAFETPIDKSKVRTKKI